MRDLDDDRSKYREREIEGRALDEPAVRRRSSASRSSQRRREDVDDEKFVQNDDISQRYPKEDSFQKQLRRRAIDRGGYQDNYEDYDDEYEDDFERAPLLVRISAWVAVLIIFFATGYMGANYFFKWADRKNDGRMVGDVVGSGTEVNQIKKEQLPQIIDEGANYVIYIPEDGKFRERTTDIKKGLKEEDANKIISMYIDTLKELNILNNDVRLISVFFSGDWAYVDVSKEFMTSLKSLGKKDAPVVPTGMLKTVAKNFPPVKKIKFYLDSNEIKDKTTIDLSKPWETMN
ncbi:MAG: GerMN domain-containing protein [Synergistaceae bacterium]